MIISIEGTDGSGKKTQTELLFNFLSKKIGESKTKLVSFPNYQSNSSWPVKMYLGGHFGDNPNVLNAKQASILFAVDRLCTMKQIESYWKDSTNVLILDRYVESNLLHQACKAETQEEMDECMEWIEQTEYKTLGLPCPDYTIFLDMPTKYSQQLAHQRENLKTGEAKDIHESNDDYMKKAYDTAHYVAKRNNWKVVHCVDENKNIKSIQDIHKEILTIMNLDK